MAIPKILVAVLIAIHLSVAAAADDTLRPVPQLHARVTDLTGTLDAQQTQSLQTTLATLEQRKGAQIAVLIVPTTAPETIEQYATRVFDAWKLGRKEVDDGALVLVAKQDRHVRIEVGYGLEGAIPDAAAKRIAHDYMSPRFAEGDFAGGIGAGVEMLTHLIDEEPLPAPKPQSRSKASSGTPFPEPWWSPVELIVGIFFGCFLGVILVLVLAWPRLYRVVLGHVPERIRTYAFGAIVAVPLTILMRHPMATLGAFAAAGTLASILGLSKPPSRRPHGFGGGGGSSGGSSGDSSSGSSGSSDSGFSGGGGSSGGGGASDSW
ncbi:MAG TPA: YgcG family protein [Rhodanobacteraceae bacterium]|jgi:uncharacterized protein|nr:YgcG family protein [Rhodanobacteraceae bacterium]